MSSHKLQRFAGWLVGLWAGVLLGVGFIGAPAGFASTFPETAGRIAGRMFMQEAYLSLGLAVLLLMVLRRIWQQTETRGSVLGADALMLLMSFGALHALSMALYAAKTALLLVLAWRLHGSRA